MLTHSNGILITTDASQLLDALGLNYETRARGDLWAPCPLHGEKDASFHVATRGPKRGRWYCFGCKKGGTLIGLVQRMRHVSHEQACSWMSEKFGTMNLPTLQIDAPIDKDEKRLMFPVTAIAIEESPLAARYLNWRGVTEEQLNRYNFMFCPDRRRILIPSLDVDWRLMTYDARAIYKACKSCNMQALPWVREHCECGGELRDPQPKTYGAAKSDGALPDEAVFGIHCLREGNYIVVTEGPFGALACDRAGHPAVALRGSRITASQLASLRMFNRTLIFMPDGDKAGQDLLATLIEPDLQTVALPQGTQPDTQGVDLDALISSALASKVSVAFTAPQK